VNYQFDVDVAIEQGVDEAIVINNFQFWIIKNKASGKHFYDGSTWTFNSVKSLGAIFPFWSAKQIRRVMNSLLSKGILVAGNFNKKGYDRTIWYSFKEESKWLDASLLKNCPNGQMQLPKRANSFAQMGTPIPDNKTQIVNTDNNNPCQGESVEVFDYWLKVMNKKSITKFTAKRKLAITSRLKEGYTVEQIKAAIDGCGKSAFHNGQNEQSKMFNDIELICRSGDKLESFFEINEKSQNAPDQGNNSGLTNGNNYATSKRANQETRREQTARIGDLISQRNQSAIADALANGTF